MTTIDLHKDHIRHLQRDSIHKTREILKILEETQNAGSKSLELLDKQYQQLEKINKTTEIINNNLEVSSGILGRIKYFFFPRKATKIEKFSKELTTNNDNNTEIYMPENLENNSKRLKIDTKLKNEFVDSSLEAELDNNLDDINEGVATLKNIALTMNYALDRDKELLDKVNSKSEIVNSNMKKMNKEITKVL